MWGFEPYVSNSHFGECRHCQAIQVSAADNVFTQIVAPTAATVQASSAAMGPQQGCSVGEPEALQQLLSARLLAACTVLLPCPNITIELPAAADPACRPAKP